MSIGPLTVTGYNFKENGVTSIKKREWLQISILIKENGVNNYENLAIHFRITLIGNPEKNGSKTVVSK